MENFTSIGPAGMLGRKAGASLEKQIAELSFLWWNQLHTQLRLQACNEQADVGVKVCAALPSVGYNRAAWIQVIAPILLIAKGVLYCLQLQKLEYVILEQEKLSFSLDAPLS